MKEYYLDRLHWIFRYTSKNFFYILCKTLCIVIGLPIYAVSFCVEMIFTFINMLFSWIPVLNVVVMLLCKAIVWLFGSTFYICILTDIRRYKSSHRVSDDITFSEEIEDENIASSGNEEAEITQDESE